MKILIIGKGVIGTIYGWALKQQNHKVFHWVRNPQEKIDGIAIKANIRLKNKKEANKFYNYQLVANKEDIKDVELIIVPVRFFAFKEAILSVLPHVAPNSLFLLMGNQWGLFDWYEEHLKNRYVFGFPHFGGAIVNGALQGWITPKMSLGEADGSFSNRIIALKQLFFELGFDPNVRKDIKEWLPVHFAWNSGLLTQAFLSDGIGKMVKKWSDIKHSFQLTREAMDVIKAKGVEVENFKEGKKAYHPLWWNTLKTMLLFLLPGLSKGADATRNDQEWGMYSKEIVKEATKMGVKAPLFAEAVAKIQDSNKNVGLS